MTLIDADFDDSDELDRDFPTGDGTADTEATVACPHCGEEVEIALDPGGGVEQEYEEDCTVCCRPWRVIVTYRDNGAATVFASALEE